MAVVRRSVDGLVLTNAALGDMLVRVGDEQAKASRDMLSLVDNISPNRGDSWKGKCCRSGERDKCTCNNQSFNGTVFPGLGHA